MFAIHRFTAVAGVALSLCAGACSRLGWQTTVWTQSVTETVSFDAASVSAINVRSHNGGIDFTGLSSDSTTGSVTIRKKAGAWSTMDADRAMEALDVFVEKADGSQKIGYRWKSVKQPGWTAQVDFAIVAPSHLALDLETHNGGVKVSGAAGNVNVVTHNGGVSAEATSGTLACVTHNGKINATYSGGEIQLETHNGGIEADLSGCGTPGGEITTHNGTVEVLVSAKTSADLRCQTHNGVVTLEAPVTTTQSSRREIKGKLGDGGKSLTVSTHNGSINIKKKG